MDKLKKILNIWASRDLTPYGKITIIKSLALSQLIFLSLFYPTLQTTLSKRLKRQFIPLSGTVNRIRLLDKLWLETMATVALKCHTFLLCYQVWRLFGSNVFMIPTIKGNGNVSFTITWILLEGILYGSVMLIPVMRIWRGGGESKIVLSRMCFTPGALSLFLKNIKLWELQKQLIWNNAYICINGNTIVKHNWTEKGITQVGHLLSENGSFLSYFEVKKKYDFNCHYAEYFSIKCAIPTTWVLHLQNTDLSLQAEETHQDELVKELFLYNENSKGL